MEDKELKKHLLVRVSCTDRDFYIFKPKGQGDFHIKFYPPAAVREKLGIERIYRTTNCALEAPARQAAKQIVESYFPDRDGNVAAVIEAQAKKIASEYATLGQIAARYRAGARTVENKENMKLSTIDANIRALSMIVESRFDAEGKRSRVDGWEAVRVDRALTAKVFNDFKNGWLRSVPQNEVAMDRAKRSVNSYINFARSIFGKDFLPLYEGLGLPDLAELRGVKLYRKTGDTRFKQIPPSVLLTMENEIRAMREERPDWYLAFYFMRELGMRREEVTEARLEWIQESSEGMEMAITKRAYYTPKGTEGFLLISPELMQDIRELTDARKPLDYLIPANTDCNREKSIHRKMSKWVRKHLGRGRRSNKTLHELRKQAISEVLETTNGNWQKTLEFSRHADIDTLINSYLAVISERPMLRRAGHLRVLPDAERAAG